MKEREKVFGGDYHTGERLKSAAQGDYESFVKCVEELAPLYGKDPEGKWGEPYLIAAAIDGGNNDILNYVLDHSSPDRLTDVYYGVDDRNMSDYDPLHYAIGQHNAAAVATLLERPEILKRLGSSDEAGDTALHHAVRFATEESTHINDASIIVSLVEQYEKQGINLNSENEYGKTALDMAISAVEDFAEGDLEYDSENEEESMTSDITDDSDDEERDLYEGVYIDHDAQRRAVEQIKLILEEHGALTSKVAREATRLGKAVKNPSNLGVTSPKSPGNDKVATLT